MNMSKNQESELIVTACNISGLYYDPILSNMSGTYIVASGASNFEISSDAWPNVCTVNADNHNYSVKPIPFRDVTTGAVHNDIDILNDASCNFTHSTSLSEAREELSSESVSSATGNLYPTETAILHHCVESRANGQRTRALLDNPRPEFLQMLDGASITYSDIETGIQLQLALLWRRRR